MRRNWETQKVAPGEPDLVSVAGRTHIFRAQFLCSEGQSEPVLCQEDLPGFATMSVSLKEFQPYYQLLQAKACEDFRVE